MIVMGDKEVWYFSIFQYLLQWYLDFKVSGARKDMVVNAVSSMSNHTMVETQDL
jgi:hypothetical protein